MKTPTKTPRDEPSLESYTYYDSDIVEQEDGRFAKFTWNNKERDKGWQFCHWEDKNGFQIFEDKHLRIAHMLVDSEIEVGSHCDFIGLTALKLVLGDNEQLHEFKYGGPLSGRGGFYITPKDNPGKVLRAKWVWMS